MDTSRGVVKNKLYERIEGFFLERVADQEPRRGADKDAGVFHVLAGVLIRIRTEG